MKWSLFLISLGFLVIATSVFSPLKYINIIGGIAMVTIGYYLYRKYSKKEKDERKKK